MSCNYLAQFASSSKESLHSLMERSKEASIQTVARVQSLVDKTVDTVVANGTKVALAIGTSIMTLAPNQANAAVTFAEATGFGGSLDLTFFYSAVPLVVTAMVAVVAVTLGIKMFKKA